MSYIDEGLKLQKEQGVRWSAVTWEAFRVSQATKDLQREEKSYPVWGANPREQKVNERIMKASEPIVPDDRFAQLKAQAQAGKSKLEAHERRLKETRFSGQSEEDFKKELDKNIELQSEYDALMQQIYE